MEPATEMYHRDRLQETVDHAHPCFIDARLSPRDWSKTNTGGPDDHIVRPVELERLAIIADSTLTLRCLHAYSIVEDR